ncbi:titin homolog [Xyrauchen texanus]|uniref:titin homolog n=1 Tax=Xyrauchen texanus TaxID=154827 RepID=UPI002241A8BF|nr:titin homolog [Xyrauchen texanus]XP_051964694.1 titin homolog [Xyrauchen texanus]XP_051964695.1 titin homolog [Xyrauchen texanus]
MAAQVEVDAGRPSMVGGRLHLSPLIDSSNKSLLEDSGGPQGPLIISSEPSKPVPGPKPRLTPKPFSVEKNPTIRPILAPKPQPKPKSESIRSGSYKPDPPSTPKPQPASKPTLPSTNQNLPASTAFKTSPKPSTWQTNKPVAHPFKPASTIASNDSNKSTTPQTRDVMRRTSFGATPARPRTDVHASTPGADWPFPSWNKQPGTSITRAKSMGYLAEVGLNYEDSKEDTGAKVDYSPAALRPQSKGSKPRPVSAVFLPNPAQSKPEVETPAPAPRWAERRPLSSDLTSKFESIGLAQHRRSAKEDSKENTPETPQREKENGADKAEGLKKTPEPEKWSQKMESKDDFKPEDEGGSSIKRRISLLLDSSSSPFSVAHVDTQGTEPRSPLLSVSDTDGAVGVKQRIKELTEDVPTTPSLPQKPQYKPRNLVSDRTKRFEAEHDSLCSSEPRGSEEFEEDLGKKFEGRFNKQEERKTSSQGAQDFPTHSDFNSDAVQTVRAAMFENVVERHNVQVIEDSASQGPGIQQENTVVPRWSHSLQIRDNTFKALEDDDPGSLVKATYREQFSSSNPVCVEHVFDTVALFGESRAVSEALPTAQLEDRALTLRSRRSAPQGEVDRPPPEMSNLIKDEESTSAAPPMEPRIPRYLRVGALQKWTDTEVNREIGAERERQKEMVRKMEEEIQRQMELHMSAVAALAEEEVDSEMERKIQIEAQREKEREREEVAAPKRPKMLDSEEQTNKPRATYFALTGQIQEPVHQGEMLDEDVIFGRGKHVWMGGEDRAMNELPFDEFSFRKEQWGPPDTFAPFKRNPTLDAAMQRDFQEELYINDTRQKLDHRLQEREREKAIREEMEIERKRLEFEKLKELERQREIKQWRDLQIKKQKEIEREKRKEIDILKEKERQKELERQREQERERQRELERQREIERPTQRERERQKQIEYERMKAVEKELEQQREFERQRQKEFEREKERMLDQERLRLREFEKQKEMEIERERQMELESQREFERQKQRELERKREIERQKGLERQRELERQQELVKQKEMEKERQRQLERQIDLDRQRELERQQDLERQQEMERQREIERQKELERHKQKELEIERWKRQKAEERENRREQEELERIKELERQQLLDFELHRQRERQLQQEKGKKRGKDKKEREERYQQPERQRGVERQRWEAEQEKIPTSPLRPKVLDLDSVSLDVWTGRDSHENSPTARWIQPSLCVDEPYKPAILDIDSFRSQTQPNTFPVKGFGGLESRGVGSMIQARPQAIQQNLLQSHPAPQVQSPTQTQFHPLSQAFFQPSPGERMRTQLPPPLQPQILHQAQPHSLPLATERSKPQSHSFIETSNWAFGQPSSALPHAQTEVWGQTQVELAVDEPLWVSAMEGSRRPISTRPSNFEQQLLRQEERGTNLTPTSTSTISPIFTPVQHPSLAPPMVSIQTPTLVVPPSLGPSVAPILTPERCWTSLPLNGGSIESLFPSSATPLARKESSVPSSQVATSSVTDPIWSPNWELVSQGQRENRATHRDKGQQKLRSRSMCRRSAPVESSTDAPLVHMRTRRSRSAHRERAGESSELVKQCVSGHKENKDTDNLVQEADSQYGTWETGLRTDDSLTPPTPSPEGNLTPSSRKPTPLHTSEHPLLTDTPDGSISSTHEQTDLAPFPETATTLLDSSALRARVQLNKKSRRAPPSRAARHSALLSQVPEGIGVGTDEWRYRDSTDEKVDCFKEEEESDSEEQAKAIEARTSSISSQPQRVALFPGMDPSALKAQLKKRGESENQTDGPSPSQPSRSPKSPFLPRAARVLPSAGGKENREESSPQWLKELKTKKRLSQYETDSTA